MYPTIEFMKRDVPCWYRLSNTSDRLLTVLVHREMTETLRVPTEESPIIRYFKEELGIEDEFHGELRGQFGFGGIIKVEKEEENPFLLLRVPLPLLRVETEKPCEFCGGSKKIYLPLFNESHPCGHCENSEPEKEHYYDWLAAYKVSASLCVLLQLLTFPKKETSAQIPQLLTVETTVKHGLHGGSLGGRYSKALVQWMINLGANITIPEMEKAMIEAHKYMNGGKLDSYNEREFRVLIDNENGRLKVKIPGNACGLHPEHYGPEPNKGYKYDCHNVDSPVQQLTLLAGLAALSDLCLQDLTAGTETQRIN